MNHLNALQNFLNQPVDSETESLGKYSKAFQDKSKNQENAVFTNREVFKDLMRHFQIFDYAIRLDELLGRVGLIHYDSEVYTATHERTAIGHQLKKIDAAFDNLLAEENLPPITILRIKGDLKQAPELLREAARLIDIKPNEETTGKLAKESDEFLQLSFKDPYKSPKYDIFMARLARSLAVKIQQFVDTQITPSGPN